MGPYEEFLETGMFVDNEADDADDADDADYDTYWDEEPMITEDELEVELWEEELEDWVDKQMQEEE